MSDERECVFRRFFFLCGRDSNARLPFWVYFREVKGLEEVMRIVKGWKVTEGVVRFRREEKVEEFNIVSREVGESKCKKLRPFSVFLTL